MRILTVLIGLLITTIINSNSQIFSQEKYLPENSPLYQEIKYEIFDKLINVIGKPKTPIELRILKDGSINQTRFIISWIYKDTFTKVTFLYIEEKAINIINNIFSDKKERHSAIAFIIGHELAHYYKFHFDYLESKKMFIDAHGYYFYKTDKKENTRWQRTDTVEAEKEADYFGAFYSYLAGFDIRLTAKKCIDTFYLGNEYKLKNQSELLEKSGYLRYEERREIADSAAKFLINRIPEFELGKYFYLTKQYRLAKICYEKILEYYPSKDILNNLGVCYLQIALENITDTNLIRFKYPFAFESTSEIEQKFLIAKAPAIVDSMLKLAIHSLERAIQLDSTYWLPHINLSSALILSHKYQHAIAYIDKIIKKLESPYLKSLALTSKGIALSLLGDNKSIIAFNDALKSDSNLDAAKYNLSLVDKKEKYSPVNLTFSNNISFKNERICGGGLDIPISNFDISIEVDLNRYLKYKFRESIDRCIDLTTKYSNSDNTQNMLFISSKSNENITTKGIKVGDPLERIFEQYQGYSYSAYSADKKYYIYEIIKSENRKTNRQGIIFEVNSDNVVSGWTLFEIEI